MVPLLDEAIESVGSGRVGESLELGQRPLRLFGVVRPEDRTNQDGLLAFGPGRMRLRAGPLFGWPGCAGQLAIFLSRSTPSCRRSSASVREKRTKPSPVGPYPLPGATTMSASSSRNVVYDSDVWPSGTGTQT